MLEGTSARFLGTGDDLSDGHAIILVSMFMFMCLFGLACLY